MQAVENKSIQNGSGRRAIIYEEGIYTGRGDIAKAFDQVSRQL